MNIETAFAKLPLDTQGKQEFSFAKLRFVERLDVGGHELIFKNKVQLEYPARKNFEPKVRTYVAKVDMTLNGPEYILSVIEANNVARKHGFPVPTTTRFFYDQNRNPGVLMTDMTCGGKYWLLGLNQGFTKSEQQTLMNMRLTATELAKTIPDSIQQLAGKATDAKMFLNFGSYHLRRNKQNGTLDTVLLDFADFTLDHGRKSHWELDQFNQENIDKFLHLLTERVNLCCQ